MSTFPSSVDVAVIGAGAAGLGAARRLREKSVNFIVLEASHRVGGRGYTEELLPGVPYDLGCHWLHCATKNPFVDIADVAGFRYDRTGELTLRHIHRDSQWATDAEVEEWQAFADRQWAAIGRAHAEHNDVSVYDITDRDSLWTALFDYIVSVHSGVDPDQTSAAALGAFAGIKADWPVVDGYGNLIATLAAGLPITLNAPATRIDWTGPHVRIETPKGVVEAGSVIVTVSTGVLGNNVIHFTPPLPVSKQEAIAGLPLGLNNRIGIALNGNPFGDAHPKRFAVMAGDEAPITIVLRPFGYPYVSALTGGRFAEWLEKAGVQASADLLAERLAAAFGADIKKYLGRHIVSAWRSDPWFLGSYSAALPGQAHQRAELARPVDARLFFAGEATSLNLSCTAHGALLSGERAADEATGGFKIA